MKYEAISHTLMLFLTFGILIFTVSIHFIPLELGFIALGLMLVSAGSMSYALSPFYGKRQFFKIGPKDLDARHRRWYYVSYASLAVAAYIALTLILAYGRGL